MFRKRDLVTGQDSEDQSGVAATAVYVNPADPAIVSINDIPLKQWNITNVRTVVYVSVCLCVFCYVD